MRRGQPVGRLVLGAGALILLVPVLAVVTLRIYDNVLVGQTERRLIGEAVLVGEAWRDAWLAAQGISPDDAPDPRPPFATGEELFPVQPVVDLSEGLLPPEPKPRVVVALADGPATEAGRRVAPLLDRSRRVNLSGARILNAEGCTVATTAGGLGACLAEYPDVREALQGRYHAVARIRETDDPSPPLTSIRRRGRVRVTIALPVFSDGGVIGVVRMSRTSQDVLESLWAYRWTFLVAFLVCVGLTVAVTVYLTRRIARPVREITAAAEAVAAGEAGAPLAPSGLVPAEVFRLGDSLDRMTGQLRQRAAYVAEFAQTVSHELKTPIAGIRGATELLTDAWEGMSEADRGRFLANIDADAARMQALVGELLELARIEHEEPDRGPASVSEVVERLRARHGDRLLVESDDAPATAAIAPARLETALDNLVDNALRHGGDGPVRLSVGTRDGRSLFRVSDTGPGISPANQARVFERFFTTARDRGGTGLGLAIVRAIARAGGGDCTFQTGPQGTTFELMV